MSRTRAFERSAEGAPAGAPRLPEHIEIDVGETPFSCFGGFMVLGRVPASWNTPGLLLRSPQGTDTPRELLRLQLPLERRWVEPTVKATPVQLTMTAGASELTAAFQSPDVLRVGGLAAGLRLSALGDRGWHAVQLSDQRWQINPFRLRMQYVLTMLRGGLQVHEDATGLTITCRPDSQGMLDLAIEECQTTASVEPFPPLEAAGQATSEHWRRWVDAHPPVAPEHRPAAAKAAYVNWSATVSPRGPLRRETMLMSKNWMNNCWSWDHGFNAVALSRCSGLEDLAWDQLMVPFDHQDAWGCLPDMVSSFQLTWSAVKPPIHGWALRLMRDAMHVGPDRLAELYPKLAAWTRWWLEHRDSDDDGLPEYFHGCDSGWDNATVFDAPCPVTTPDLPALLVLQMDVLSELADELGRSAEASQWRDEARRMLERLLQLWDGERFTARYRRGELPRGAGDCLLNLVPIVLGDRLPQAQREVLAAQLRDPARFLTEYGLATQSPASAAYQADGYWRGPIWAPPVMLIYTGLTRGGYHDQAQDLARRFCGLCAQSGFAENFDAVTGQPLRDPAYTWTSSTFLFLAQASQARADHGRAAR